MTPYPASVRIGPVDYAIQMAPDLRHEGTSLDGRVHNDTAVIQLRAELGSQQMYQVFWHEILHALVYQGQLGRCRLNGERAIDSLAWGILQVLRDNPWLR